MTRRCVQCGRPLSGWSCLNDTCPVADHELIEVTSDEELERCDD